MDPPLSYCSLSVFIDFQIDFHHAISMHELELVLLGIDHVDRQSRCSVNRFSERFDLFFWFQFHCCQTCLHRSSGMEKYEELDTSSHGAVGTDGEFDRSLYLGHPYLGFLFFSFFFLVSLSLG